MKLVNAEKLLKILIAGIATSLVLIFLFKTNFVIAMGCFCGDGVCNPACEDYFNCPADCPPPQPPEPPEPPPSNNPARGTLTVSSIESCKGQYITFTISAQDLQGVEKVCLNDDCQSCGFQSSCTKTWQTKKDIPGTYTFSGKIYGKKPDGSQEIVFTNPSSISVTWKDCSPPIPVVDLKVNGSDGPIIIPYNSSVTLSWTSNNVNSCYASGDWSGSKPISGTETISGILSQKTFTITCSGPGGTASDNVVVYVSLPSFSVSLSANPSSGCAPLNNVSLTANVSRDFSGNLTYYFDCTSDGSFELIQTTSQNSFTASNLCSFSNTGTFFAKVRVEGAGMSREASVPINVYSCYQPPTYPAPSVDLKVNGQDGLITVLSGSSITLSWTSTNANYCTASGNWSGTKSISGIETISNVTSTRIFTLTCYGPGGSAADSVTVNVSAPGVFTVYKTVRNLSKGTGFEKSINVEPGEVLVFAISVKAGENPVSNLLVQDILPDKIIYRGDLKINNVSVAGDILTGLNIGNLAPNETKLITFKADVASKENFPFGQTKLKNKVLVSSSQTSLSDEAEIIVSKTAVAGAVTGIPTGLTNNLLFDSFILPLILSLTLVWLFKSKIINFEAWFDEKKRNYQEFKAKKLLQLKVALLKNKK